MGPFLAVPFGPFGPVSGPFWGVPPPAWGRRGAEWGGGLEPKTRIWEATTGGGQPLSFGPGPEPGKICFCDVLACCLLLLLLLLLLLVLNMGRGVL